MKKPENYDTTEAMTGEFKQLPPGAYNCIIRDAHEITSQSGKNMLQLRLDIADGEYKDYFKNQYISAGKKYGDAKWRGIYNQLTEGDSLGYFKGLIQDIETSNPGYKFNFDEKTLINRQIGGVFGREQYRNTNGELKFAVKCLYCVDRPRVKDITPPPDKLLEQAKTNGNGGSYGNTPTSGNMVEIDVNDELPF